MEWYWILTLCTVTASIGLLIGCCCRAAGRADNSAGCISSEPTKAVTWIKIPNRTKPDINREFVHSEPFDIEELQSTADKLIKFNRTHKRKKFRWNNYYKALRLCRKAG